MASIFVMWIACFCQLELIVPLTYSHDTPHLMATRGSFENQQALSPSLLLFFKRT